MPEIYTSNDLVRFIYNETEPSETNFIMELIELDAEVAAEFEQLQETVSLVESASLNAHPTSINLILEYAHRLDAAVAK
jgi:hypothetical protein